MTAPDSALLDSTKFAVETLGPCRIASPMELRGAPCVDEGSRVLACSRIADLDTYLRAGLRPPSFEPAGPRRQIFFDPGELGCGIVTCGGLCPGLNNVIRSIVLELHYGYGIRRIVGFPYGYAGLSPKSGFEPIMLSPSAVHAIHQHGGTILGTSRGPQDISEMVDTLVHHRLGVLFAIGGDGTLRGADALAREIARRGLKIGVVCVPKTIDNDLAWIERSFGFATAVDEARTAIVAAHDEARGHWNGIGLVKLMGRQAGFIAAHASLANSDVNFCLVPEVPFSLHGEHGFLRVLERRLLDKRHAVIVTAEGAGQSLLHEGGEPSRDASGNIRLKDIGAFLKREIEQYLTGRGMEMTIKYIDPSYTVRSLPANSLDSEFCLVLGQHAVHAGLAGRTNLMIGYWNRYFTHVPIPLAVDRPARLDPAGETWQRVLESTGQPASMQGRREASG